MPARKPVPSVAGRSGSRKGPKFTTTETGGAVRVSPGKGGVNIGTATHCTTKQAHGNVRSSY
jgi:hypothetical protein